jgi:hypothetical protein
MTRPSCSGWWTGAGSSRVSRRRCSPRINGSEAEFGFKILGAMRLSGEMRCDRPRKRRLISRMIYPGDSYGSVSRACGAGSGNSLNV